MRYLTHCIGTRVQLLQELTRPQKNSILSHLPSSSPPSPSFSPFLSHPSLPTRILVYLFRYFAHPLWGNGSESEFPHTAPSSSTFSSLPHSSTGVFSKLNRLDLERNLLAAQQQLRVRREEKRREVRERERERKRRERCLSLCFLFIIILFIYFIYIFYSYILLLY